MTKETLFLVIAIILLMIAAPIWLPVVTYLGALIVMIAGFLLIAAPTAFLLCIAAFLLYKALSK